MQWMSLATSWFAKPGNARQWARAQSCKMASCLRVHWTPAFAIPTINGSDSLPYTKNARSTRVSIPVKTEL
jgi:hypothetical protein